MFEEPKFTKIELNQFKWLVLFGFFIIFFQSFQYFNTKTSYSKFNKLFENTSIIQGFVNDIITGGSIVQRHNLNLFLSDSKQEKNTITSSRLVHERRIEKAIYKMEQLMNSDGNPSLGLFLTFYKLKYSWLGYRKAYNSMDLNDVNKIDNYRKKILRPKYEYFLESTNEIFYSNISYQSDVTKKISDQTEKRGFYLLIFGNIILFIVVLFLGYIIFTENRKLKQGLL